MIFCSLFSFVCSLLCLVLVAASLAHKTLFEIGFAVSARNALWSITAKNTGSSTGPPARPFACLLAPLAHLLAPDCSLCWCPLLRSLVCSLAHFAHSLARGKVID